MDCNCDSKVITVYKGFGTYWNGKSLLKVSFKSKLDLTGFSAIFKLGDISKTYTNIVDGFTIDLTKQETSTLPIGLNYGELIVVDNETNKKPFTTALPFEVKNWVSGDIHLDNFNLTIDTKIKKNKLEITVETANLAPEDIEKYIREHNESEEAHPYIQNLISEEVTARENADIDLQNQITEISILANGYIHEQGIASDEWVIEHNLGKFPSVSVVDSAESEIIAEIEYVNNNIVKVILKGASKGKAYLN